MDFNNILNKDYIVISNDKLPEDKEYKYDIYNKFKEKQFNFKQIKRLKDDYIYNYNKIFLDSYSFHAVKPCENQPTGYILHVKNVGKEFYINHENKVLLILE